MSLSPRRIEAAMSLAQQLKAQLTDDADDKLLLGTLEGETEVFELIDALAENVLGDERMIEIGEERLGRRKRRVERTRDLIARMLVALEIDKPLERALYTASLTRTQKPFVTDEALVPERFKVERVDTRSLGAALRHGEDVPGAMLGNPEPSLRIYTR